MDETCVNVTTNLTDSSSDVWHNDYRQPAALIIMVLALITLITNGVIMVVYAKDRKLRTNSHFFLINLVLADFLVGVALLLHGIVFLMPRMSLNQYVCLAQFSALGE